MLCNHSNSHVNPYSSTCDRSVCYDLFLERGRNRPTTEGVAARTGADKLCSPAVDTILQVRWRFWWNSIPLIGCLRLFHEQGQHISTD